MKSSVTWVMKNTLQGTITYPTKSENEHHVQKCFGKGYVMFPGGHIDFDYTLAICFK